jgi:hypothetical protein
MAAVVASIAAASGEGVIVGVMEEVPGVYSGEGTSNHVRVAFRRDAGGWRSYPSDCKNPGCLSSITKQYPPELNWWITFDGRALGKVLGRTPDDFAYYADVGLQDVPGKRSVPRIGSPSTDFGGFTDASVHRPLIAVSKLSFADPDGWKPAHLSAQVTQSLRGQFRRKFPTLCRDNGLEDSKSEPYPFKDSDVAVVKAHSSKAGWAIAQLHLPDAIECNDKEAGFGLDDPTFLVRPDGSGEYLDQGIWLVDAGDYDNDGKSELVFAINRYNRGGYELFYDDFRKRAIFQFSYH